MNEKSNYTGVLIPIGVVLLLLAQIFLYRQPTEAIAYSDFHRLLVARQLDNLEIGSDQITGSVRMPGAAPLLPASAASGLAANGEPWRFSTVRVSDDHLIEDLANSGVRYTGVADRIGLGAVLGWIVPILMLAAIWSVFMRRGGGGLRDFSGIGKSKPSRLRKYPKQSRAAFLPKGKLESFFPPSGN